MVTSLAWPSSWRWVGLPAKGEASREVEAGNSTEEKVAVEEQFSE